MLYMLAKFRGITNLSMAACLDSLSLPRFTEHSGFFLYYVPLRGDNEALLLDHITQLVRWLLICAKPAGQPETVLDR